MFCLNGSHVCERLLDNLRENKNGMFLVSVEQINFPVCADESSSGAAYLFVILLWTHLSPSKPEIFAAA